MWRNGNGKLGAIAILLPKKARKPRHESRVYIQGLGLDRSPIVNLWLLGNVKRPRNPETQVEAPVVHGERGAAAGRTEGFRIEVPGTAADDTGLAISASEPRRTIRGRPVVVNVIAVLRPHPHIAKHVIEAKRIGRE